LTEYRTYLQNKNQKIKWAAVEDIKIYNFLEEVFSLPNNNPIMPFETSQDIVFLLREQWAGLFQRMLQQSVAEGSLAAARELRQGIETVQRLVELLQSQGGVQEAAQEAVRAVLLPNHAAFRRIQRVTRTTYRVFFTNLSELNSWLKARNFEAVEENAWDQSSFREWFLKTDKDNWDLIKVSTDLFDEDDRFDPNRIEWSDELIKREVRAKEIPFDDDDDGIPF
jgi:hypothetical protein